MVRIVSIALLILMCLPAIAETPAPILRSLPPSDQKNTAGDEGLQTFTVAGAQAVMVDELNFCGEGRSAFTA
jgi:hypothetical protein